MRRLYGSSRSTGVARWTADQYPERSILHLGHVSYQIHLIFPRFSPAKYSHTVQNHALKDNAFDFIFMRQVKSVIIGLVPGTTFEDWSFVLIERQSFTPHHQVHYDIADVGWQWRNTCTFLSWQEHINQLPKNWACNTSRSVAVWFEFYISKFTS